jgi:hypothetical protein
MRRLAFALLVVVGAGCHRGATHCAPGSRSTLEIRDGSGAMTLALKGTDVCDGQLRYLGTLQQTKDSVTLTDAAGNLELALATDPRPGTAVGRDRAGPHLRLFRDNHELRVLRADGVPLGSIVPEPQHAVIFNPASSPLAKVSMRDGDAVVTDMAGTALTYVVPAREPGPAGVFGVPSLVPSEALTIYIYWSR